MAHLHIGTVLSGAMLVSAALWLVPAPRAQAEEPDATSGSGVVRAKLRYVAQHRDSNLHVLQDSSSGVADTSVQQFSALAGLLGYETSPPARILRGGNLLFRRTRGQQPRRPPRPGRPQGGKR